MSAPRGATGDPHAVPPRTVSLRPENNLLVHAEQHVRLAAFALRGLTRPADEEEDLGFAIVVLVDCANRWNTGRFECSWPSYVLNRIRWGWIRRRFIGGKPRRVPEVPLFLLGDDDEAELERPEMAVEDPEPHAAETRADVEKLLATLTPKEADVIRRRFGIGTEPATFDEIGEDLGVGRERVRQIERKALATLRKRAARPSRFRKPASGTARS